MAIPNGTFTTNCDGSLNNFCQYNCDTGYQANPSYSNIVCSMPGVWSPLTDQLCSSMLYYYLPMFIRIVINVHINQTQIYLPISNLIRTCSSKLFCKKCLKT